MAIYLRTVVLPDMRVFASWEGEPTYPAALVFAGGSRQAGDDASYNDNRIIDLTVLVVTESAEKNLLSARDHNALHRSTIMNALCVSDLKAHLIASGVADIAFSGVLFAEDVLRRVEGRRFETEIGLTVYAEPVTGS